MVDNSTESTGYSLNESACANTTDKIFLPSYKEIVYGSYGFSAQYSDKARQRVTSDYTRSKGVWISTDSSNFGNGCWWLHSPSIRKDAARYVSEIGAVDYYLNSHAVDSADSGIVPALTISLS